VCVKSSLLAICISCCVEQEREKERAIKTHDHDETEEMT
jgi:hypothetical protein